MLNTNYKVYYFKNESVAPVYKCGLCVFFQKTDDFLCIVPRSKNLKKNFNQCRNNLMLNTIPFLITIGHVQLKELYK